MISGDPGKIWFGIKGRGTGTNWKIMSRGEKGVPPFNPVFRGRGRGETLTRQRGHSGGVASMMWQGVKGVAPERPPAKGAGRGTAVSMVLSSLISRAWLNRCVIETWETFKFVIKSWSGFCEINATHLVKDYYIDGQNTQVAKIGTMAAKGGPTPDPNYTPGVDFWDHGFL